MRREELGSGCIDFLDRENERNDPALQMFDCQSCNQKQRGMNGTGGFPGLDYLKQSGRLPGYGIEHEEFVCQGKFDPDFKLVQPLPRWRG